jgi:hypothetical protein
MLRRNFVPYEKAATTMFGVRDVFGDPGVLDTQESILQDNKLGSAPQIVK